MNLGAPELVIVLLMVVGIGLPIYGAIKAGQNGDGGWLAGMIVGIFFGVGWIVALIYLLAIAPNGTRNTTA
jgi:hypothetical protein